MLPPFVTDDASASENDTLGGIDYGTRGMGVCADPGSYRWCQALSRSRWSCATNTNTNTQNQRAPSEQQKLDAISKSTTVESATAIPSTATATTTTITSAITTATTIASAAETICAATTTTRATTLAETGFTVKTTKRRRYHNEDEDVDEDVDGCSSPIYRIRTRTCPVSTRSIQALKFVLIWLLALLAKHVQAHNIPGKSNIPNNITRNIRENADMFRYLDTVILKLN